MTTGAYSAKQTSYIESFIRQANEELTQFFNDLNNPSKEPSDPALEKVSAVVDATTAGLTIAGTVGAAPTLGIALGAAAAAIVLIKTGEACYKFVRQYANGSVEILTPEEAILKTIHLNAQNIIREVAYTAANRYSQVIEDVLADKGVKEFAQYGAERLMKKVIADLTAQLSNELKVDPLINYLLSSMKFSVTHEPKTVTLKEASRRGGLIKTNIAYAKMLYCRCRWAVYDEQSPIRAYTIMATPNENKLLTTDSTVPDFGYMTVPLSLLTAKTSAIDASKLKKLDKKTIPNYAAIEEQFVSYYKVSRDDLVDYLQQVELIAPNAPIPSLNEYLSKKFEGLRVIAECHDDRLRGLALDGGDFSEVNFTSADLSGCSLNNTQWREAHVEEALFDENILTNTSNFQRVYAERSTWKNLTLTGNFCLSKMNGAKLSHCKLSPDLIDKGSEWEDLELDDVEADKSQLDAIAQRLTEEHKLRIELVNKIDGLTKQLESLSESVTANALNTVNKEQFAEMQQTMAYLEEQQNTVAHSHEKLIYGLKEQVAAIGDILHHNEAAILEIQHVQSEQELRLSALAENDLELGERLSSLESVQSILSRVTHNWDEEINTPQFQQIKKTYIPVLVAPYDKTEYAPQFISERLNHFIQSNESLLFFHGEIGSGKTLSIELWEEELLSAYVDERNWLAVHIKLSHLRVNSGENHLRAALRTLLENPQIDLLMDKYRCVLILDGLDECSASVAQSIIEDCIATRGFKIKPKIVLTSTTSFVVENNLLPLLKAEHCVDCAIQPFNDKQIEDYLHLYHIRDAYFSERYGLLNAQLMNLRSLQRTPLMLHIICEVLTSLPPGQLIPRTNSEFLLAAIRIYFLHVKERLPEEYADFDQFMYYLEQLSFLMFTSGKSWLERSYKKLTSQRHLFDNGIKNHGHDLLDCLFANSAFQKTGKLCPVTIRLKRKGAEQVIHVEFIHQAVCDFVLARQLLNYLLVDDLEARRTCWNYDYITEWPSVVEFLTGLVKQREVSEQELIVERLLELIYATKDDKQFDPAGSNALSVMCALGLDLGRYDLSNISATKSNLTHAFAPYLLARNADLSESCTHEGLFVNSVLSEAKLRKTRFVKSISFVQLESMPETFAVLPVANENVVACDKLNPDGNQYEITIVRVSDGYVFSTLSGHQTKILCMSWGKKDTQFRLASAGESGSVRVWGFEDYQGTGTQIAKLKQHKHRVLAVSWALDGNLLATAGEDKTVIVWDVDRKTAIFVSEEHQLAVRSLIWGNKDKILLSAGEDPIIRVWSYDETTNHSSLKPMMSINLQSVLSNDARDYLPINSIALSVDNKELAIAGGNQGLILIIKVDEHTAPLRLLLGHKKLVSSVIWNELLYSVSYDCTIRIWDPVQATCLRTFQEDQQKIKKIELLSDGKNLISGGGSQTDKLSVWNTNAPTDGSENSEQAKITCSSCKGPYLATGFSNGFVSLWYMAQSPVKSILSQQVYKEESIQTLAISPDGQFLASIGQGKTIRITALTKPRQGQQTKINPTGNAWFNHFQWIFNEEEQLHVLVSASDGIIYQYAVDFTAETEIHTTLVAQIKDERSASSVFFVEIARNLGDNQPIKLASTRGSEVLIWESKQNKFNISRRLNHPNAAALTLLWSPNGQFLASRGSNNSIYIWDTKTWQYFKEIKFPTDKQCWTWGLSYGKQWLVIGLATEIQIYDASDTTSWNQAPNRYNFGASALYFFGNYLIIIKNNGIYLINSANFNTKEFNAKPPIIRVKPDLWFDQSDMSNCEGLSDSTRAFLKNNGVNFTDNKYTLFAIRASINQAVRSLYESTQGAWLSSGKKANLQSNSSESIIYDSPRAVVKRRKSEETMPNDNSLRQEPDSGKETRNDFTF